MIILSDELLSLLIPPLFQIIPRRLILKHKEQQHYLQRPRNQWKPKHQPPYLRDNLKILIPVIDKNGQYIGYDNPQGNKRRAESTERARKLQRADFVDEDGN